MSAQHIQKSESLHIVRLRVWLLHITSLGVFFVPVTQSIIWVAIAGFFLRVFAWEAGSHRYFSHRSYKTSRTFQLILAVLAAACGQRGPIWWAAHHRKHHRHSDEALDPHSPVVRGFWYAHMGWILDDSNLDTDLSAARDLAQFSELVWVNKYHYVFPYGLLAILFFAGQYTQLFGRAGLGLSVVVWVFFLSTMLSLQATCVVNTITHGNRKGVFHSRPFHTADTTTNCWLLCIPTMGASWHNNHHRYMNAARAGFFWWQLDLAYLVLRGLGACGVVWDLHPVPPKVLQEAAGLKPGHPSEVAIAIPGNADLDSLGQDPHSRSQ